VTISGSRWKRGRGGSAEKRARNPNLAYERDWRALETFI